MGAHRHVYEQPFPTRYKWHDLHTCLQPAQLWAIDPSLLLVYICGTVYHFISTLGDRSFTAAGPHLWNSLPLHFNSGRSILHCCWSTPVEQSTTSSPWLWTIAFRVSPVTENAFVWLKIAAPSDLLLDVVRFTNVTFYLFTYLLTYLLKTVLL